LLLQWGKKLRLGLVPKNFYLHPSHRMFGHITHAWSTKRRRKKLIA
jgi:hypothetical protein